MLPFNSDERLFVFNKKRWKSICEKDYCIPEEPTVTEVENGVILPLRKRTDFVSSDATFEGGVCDQTGKFVAGHIRNPNEDPFNLSCTKGYTIPKTVKTRHETVVYCGVLFRHFGHVLQESLVRLWWFARHQDTDFKLVFLDVPVFGDEFKFYNVLEAAGITRNQMEIVAEPTMFDRIIVPQESMYMWCNYRPAISDIYTLIRTRVQPGPYRKVYLSRTAFATKDGINEEYFESFFEKCGFKIIYPEQLPFEEQVSIMAGAEEVAGTGGTLMYLTFFCRPHTKVVFLNRNTNIYTPMYAIMQANSLDYYVIDANFNFLPTNLIGDGVYFYGPTVYWKEYLDSVGVSYKQEEVSFEKYVKPLLYDYILKWGETYIKPKSYKVVHNFGMIDVVEGIHRIFLSEAINKKSLPDRDDVVKLKKENTALKSETATLKGIFQSALTEQIKNRPEELQKVVQDSGIDNIVLVDDRQIDQLKKRVAQLEEQLHDRERSLSWRITKLFRKVKEWIKSKLK